jgi:hypothetical protein
LRKPAFLMVFAVDRSRRPTWFPTQRPGTGSPASAAVSVISTGLAQAPSP